MVPAQEVEALAALYDACGGESWAWRSNEEKIGAKWNFTVDELTGELLSNPCSTSAGSTWQGVSCTLPPIQCSNQTCSVSTLSLEAYNLKGSLPSELGNLLKLKSLDVNNNELIATIPPVLGNLSRLESLDLDINQLTGTIPPELGNLLRLESLNLDINKLTGTIPSELGNLVRLELLDLFKNRFTGTIPAELGNLSGLESLYLD